MRTRAALNLCLVPPLLLFALGCLPADAKVLPLVVIYARAADSASDMRSMIDLRQKLRNDGRVEVLTDDPASPAVMRAAQDAGHSDWLNGLLTSDTDRAALAHALGADFFVVAGQGPNGGPLVELKQISSARVWDLVEVKPEAAARALESDIEKAMETVTMPWDIPSVHAVPSAASPAPSAVNAASAVPVPAAVNAAPAVPVPATVNAAPVTPTPTIVNVTPVTPAPAIVNPEPPLPAALPQPAPAPAAPLAAPTAAPAPVPDNGEAAIDRIEAIEPLLHRGDTAIEMGSFPEAIEDYRNAVDEAPLSAVPRLRLANAYLKAGMNDRALSEAERAIKIDPNSDAVRQFLQNLDGQTGSSEGEVAIDRAAVSQAPNNAARHLQLADALWNDGNMEAEREYKSAETLAGLGSDIGRTACGHLARLYAAQSRYKESLEALKNAGPSGYALALLIIQNRSDALSQTLDSAGATFVAGKSTREDYYDTAQSVSRQTEALADFVVQVTPPPPFKLSHLHRVLATHLLAEQAAVIVDYIETNDPGQSDKAAELEKEAQTEMLTARAAEQKQGLWSTDQTAGTN